MTLSRTALDANSINVRHRKMKMRWVSAALASAGIFCWLTAGNAAECTGRVISIEPTKHARLGCTQKYQDPAVRRQSQKIALHAKAQLPRLRVFGAGRPVFKGGGIYRVGNPYVIAGRTYTPQKDPNYRAEGKASWYGKDFHGRRTANGEIFDMHAISAAHPTLPLPSYVRVTNLDNHRSLVVRLNDRGPYHGHRLIDVSVRAAKLLGFYDQGLAQVRVEYLRRAELEGSNDDTLAATLQHEDPIAARVAATVSIQADK
jgi:rare lipoprotein A (peptidoglycan hydrolase)